MNVVFYSNSKVYRIRLNQSLVAYKFHLKSNRGISGIDQNDKEKKSLIFKSKVFVINTFNAVSESI